MYYAFIIDDKINGTGQCSCTSDNLICLEITEEQYNLVSEKGNNYYLYQDGVLVLNPEYDSIELAKAKEKKQEENTSKAKEAIENGYVIFKEAQFETNAQTVGDLTATTLLMQASGLETYDWLSKDDKVVTMTVEDFTTLGGIIAGYKNSVWNSKYINYKQAVEEAETLEDVEAIVIDYDMNESVEEPQEEPQEEVQEEVQEEPREEVQEEPQEEVQEEVQEEPQEEVQEEPREDLTI